LKVGDIITSINDVSLRVSSADAADPQLSGIAQRRLTRTLQKAKPGDEVRLCVNSGGQNKTITVKTVSAADLVSEPIRSTISRTMGIDSDRPSVGLSLGVSGTARDTLGVFVNSVNSNGPAEKAGIIEGNRIASINGVDLRVPREDYEDMSAASARASRFNRELQKLKAGDRVDLRVWDGNRYRDVAVTTVKASDLPSRGFQIHIGDGQFFIGNPEVPMTLRTLPGNHMPNGVFRLDAGPNGFDMQGFDGEALRRSMQELRTRLQRLGPDLEGLRFNEFITPDIRVAPRIRTSAPVAPAAPRTIRRTITTL
jgi:hypothetical protein